MFHKQTGFWPRVTLIAGILLAFYFLLSLLLFLFNFITLAVQLASTAPLTAGGYLRLLVFVVFYSILIFLSYIVFSLFPAVRLTQTGLEYRSLFITRRVHWAEMVDVQDARFPKGAKVLVFFRKPENALRTILDNAIRLYPNQTYGAIAGVHEPVIILSKGLEKRDMLLNDLQRQLVKQGRKKELDLDAPEA
ncbi:MAG TPA: PH domain-containing protein [Anaerolineaceae bacterium]